VKTVPERGKKLIRMNYVKHKQIEKG